LDALSFRTLARNRRPGHFVQSPGHQMNHTGGVKAPHAPVFLRLGTLPHPPTASHVPAAVVAIVLCWGSVNSSHHGSRSSQRSAIRQQLLSFRVRVAREWMPRLGAVNEQPQTVDEGVRNHRTAAQCVKVGGEPVTAAELGNSVKHGFDGPSELRNSAFSYQNRKKPNLEVPLVDCILRIQYRILRPSSHILEVDCRAAELPPSVSTCPP